MTGRAAAALDTDEALFVRPADALALAFIGVLLVLTGVAHARGVPGAAAGAERLVAAIAILLALRAAPMLHRGRVCELLAAIAPIGMTLVDWALDPVVDLMNPTLRDAALLRADRFLFGETPSLSLQGWLTPWFTEALFLGYFSYFGLLLAPILLFWLRRDRESLERYVQAIVLFFVTNLSFYVLVPAIGPRFTLASAYARPLHGVLFGDRIQEMFLHVPYFRDCFPSGHTAGTLFALAFTFRRSRGFFGAALPLGILCICATVLCRFHYAIDLVCAAPLTLWSLHGSRALDPGLVGRFASALAVRWLAPRAATDHLAKGSEN